MRHPHRPRHLFLTLALCLLAGSPAFAQEVDSKKPLVLEDYDRWRTVISTQISDDGRWMTYAYGHREGEDTLHVEELDGGKRRTH